MPVDNVIKTCSLGNGVLATLSDRTSHYFGGYYHVRIQVSAEIPVSAATFSDPAEFADALQRFGHFVSFSRTLEKMAVPDNELEAVRQHLLESFDCNVLPYLLREDFADSFVQSEYRATLKSRAVIHRYHT